MKKTIIIAFGITMLPAMCISVFSLINYLLSLLFSFSFYSVNHSPIWIIEGIISLIIIIAYFIEQDENGNL